MVEGVEEFVDRVGSEGVSDFRPVEGHPDHTSLTGSVVGDVGEVEAGDLVPGRAVKYL